MHYVDHILRMKCYFYVETCANPPEEKTCARSPCPMLGRSWLCITLIHINNITFLKLPHNLFAIFLIYIILTCNRNSITFCYIFYMSMYTMITIFTRFNIFTWFVRFNKLTVNVQTLQCIGAYPRP